MLQNSFIAKTILFLLLSTVASIKTNSQGGVMDSVIDKANIRIALSNAEVALRIKSLEKCVENNAKTLGQSVTKPKPNNDKGVHTDLQEIGYHWVLYGLPILHNPINSFAVKGSKSFGSFGLAAIRTQ